MNMLMRKSVAMFLSFVIVLGLVGCQINEPTFEDFAKYIDDFTAVRDYLLTCDLVIPSGKHVTVYLNDDILTITDTTIADTSMLLDAVNNLCDKGFTYVAVCEDHMTFWEDETGYYGVLWSQESASSVRRIVGAYYPYRRFRKLTNEWYEVGALDSI